MNGLNEAQLAQLKRTLEQRRAELESQQTADALAGDLPASELETSPVDKATNRLLTDLALEAAGLHAAQLTSIRMALGKFDDGSYGLCEQCGNEIGFARLAARPEARLCITCQARAEKR